MLKITVSDLWFITANQATVNTAWPALLAESSLPLSDHQWAAMTEHIGLQLRSHPWHCEIEAHCWPRHRPRCRYLCLHCTPLHSNINTISLTPTSHSWTRTAVAPSLSLNQRQGTLSVTIYVNLTCVLIAFIVHWKRSSLNNTQHIQCIRGVSLAMMHYINWHWHWHWQDVLHPTGSKTVLLSISHQLSQWIGWQRNPTLWSRP